MLTLWDLVLKPIRDISVGPAPVTRRGNAAARRAAAQERYGEIVRDMLARYRIKVRRWRKSMSGVAWETLYRDGSIGRYLEAPRPRSPLSLAILLHEIGHHAIGFGTYKPRCLEEYHAWQFALAQMEQRGVPITERVRARVRKSVKYAVDKARRRGIRQVPPELHAYTR